MRTETKIDLWRWIILAIMLGAVIFLAASCKVVQTATTDHRATDTLYITKTDYKIDSVYVDRWHTIKEQGDTIYRLDSVVCYKWHIVTKTDTLIQSKTDSVYIDKVQTKEVRRRSGYDRFVSVGFWILLTILLVSVGWWIYRKFRFFA